MSNIINAIINLVTDPKIKLREYTLRDTIALMIWAKVLRNT